jgi:hypothetical protein
MHYTTVWFILQRIRFAMGYREENLTLAGYIEMDEAFFGGRNRSKGKPKPKGQRQPPSGNKRQVLVQRAFKMLLRQNFGYPLVRSGL